MICFIAWGTKISGGVQNLVINLTSQMAANGDMPSIVGFRECFIVKTLKERFIDFEFIDLDKLSKEEINARIKSKVLVFTSFTPRMGIYRFKIANPRILYWNVFPTTLKNANKIKIINIQFLTKILTKYLVRNNGIVFMDGNGVEESKSIFNKRYSLNNVNFLPIPIPIAIENNYLKNKLCYFNNNELNITYVGRGLDWKINPILKFILDFKKIKKNNKKIIFHIITQEPNKYIKTFSNYDLGEDVLIKYRSKLVGKEYIDYLKNNSDFHVSMGTAALDGASLGIPTVILDFSKDKMPVNYRYKWLFDTNGYSLGNNVSEIDSFDGHSIDQIMSPFISNDFVILNELSIKTYNYVQNNHSLKSISTRLINYSQKSNAYLKPVLRKTIINNFLVRKVFTILKKAPKHDINNITI